MRTKFEDYVERGRVKHGDRFGTSSLAEQFIPYFNSGRRIRVLSPWGEESTGTVGVSTGWSPVFLLMARSDSIGSTRVLHDNDIILDVKYGRRYSSLWRSRPTIALTEERS